MALNFDFVPGMYDDSLRESFDAYQLRIVSGDQQLASRHVMAEASAIGTALVAAITIPVGAGSLQLGFLQVEGAAKVSSGVDFIMADHTFNLGDQTGMVPLRIGQKYVVGSDYNTNIFAWQELLPEPKLFMIEALTGAVLRLYRQGPRGQMFIHACQSKTATLERHA